MKRAYCLIRAEPVYRREAFINGLRARGFEVTTGRPPAGPAHNDVLLIWNRYGEMHDLASQFEAAGGQVIVAENGFLGVDRRDRRIYAIADGAHNGAGFWHVGSEDRFSALKVSLAPWRKAGTHVLIAPNREFGMPGMIQPNMFAEHMVRQLQTVTKRPIKVRPHPGNNPPKIPLAADLVDCWAVVIWSSSVGVESLVNGIPVFCMAPHWIARGSTFQNLKMIDNPPLETVDREKSMRALAWAQWTVDEIAAGVPFAHLCEKPVRFAPA